MMRKLPLILIIMLLFTVACGQAEPDVATEPEAVAVRQEAMPTDVPVPTVTTAPTAVPTTVPAIESTEEPMDDSEAESMTEAEEMVAEAHDDTAMMDDEKMAESDDAMLASDSYDDTAMMDDEKMAESDDEMAMDDDTDDYAMEESDSHGDADDDTDMMDDEIAESHDDTAAMAAEETMAEEAAPVVVNRPKWQTLPLVNVATGQSFTLADYAGKTVFVEPMATWCGNCRQQLANVLNAMASTGGGDVAFVVLSVETNLSNEKLLQYAQNNGYPFDFAVMTPDLLQALVTEFGRGVANPPGTPHFIIRPDGTFTNVATGLESTQQLIDEINAN